MFASRWICKHIMRISCTCIYPYVPSGPLISTTYSSMFISHTLQPDWTVYHSPNTSHTYLDLWLSAACCLHLDFFSSASQHTHILSSGIRAILLCNCTSSMKTFLMPPRRWDFCILRTTMAFWSMCQTLLMFYLALQRQPSDLRKTQISSCHSLA